MLNKILLVLSLTIFISTTAIASPTVNINLHNESECIQNLPNSKKFVPILAPALAMLIYMSKDYKVIAGPVSYPGQQTKLILLTPEGNDQYALYYELLNGGSKGMMTIPMPLSDNENIYLANSYDGYLLFSKEPISC